MASGGRGRGRGCSSIGLQKALEAVQQGLQDAENAARGPPPPSSGQPLGMSSLTSIVSSGIARGQRRQQQDRSLETQPESSSSPTSSDSPSPQFLLPRGRGGGGTHFYRMNIPTPEVSPDESAGASAQMEGLSIGRGRGRGRARLPVIAMSTEDPSQIRKEAMQGRRGTRGSSSSSACSDISDDLENVEREIVVKRGTKGQIIPVTCNFIRLSINGKLGLFEYHVDFDPPMESRRGSRIILKSREDLLGTVRNFDGAKLYLPFRLADKKVEFWSENPFNPEIQIKTTIRYVKENKMGECVHFYNVLFRRIMETLGWVEMKRNFYDYRSTHALPQHKLEIWPGYVTAVDAYEGGLMLMCDSSFRVLRTNNLYDVLREFQVDQQRGRGGREDVQTMYENYTVGQIVMTKYNRRNYRVDGIDWTQSPLSTFPYKNGKITYKQYYWDMYEIDIKNLGPPLIANRPRQTRIDGRRAPAQVLFLIPELCYLTGMSEDITSNYNIMQDMAHITRINPHARNTRLKQFVENVKSNQDALRILNDWGLHLEDGGIELDARLMGMTKIVFGNGVELAGSADFTKASTVNPCYEPVPVRHFAIFCTAQDRDKGQTFLQSYSNVCKTIGISVESRGQLLVVNPQQAGRNLQAFREIITKNLHPQMQFIVVISPRAQDDLYSLVKRICCVEQPIPSQVVVAKTLGNDKKLRTIMAKIAMQINCKLGGSLWTIKIPLMERIMFVGMDVYHDPKRKLSSVTGLVASLNTEQTRYFSRVSYQCAGQETVDSVRQMFRDALIAFFTENDNAWPDRIIVFRDGVGDGQLEVTEKYEVVQMTETISQLCDNHPKFTFVVVQKRINARFFAHDGMTLINPSPGTVVDHTVTRRHYYDFFLVSQLVRMGTVSPTHYIVLKDIGDISPDLIQKFAYVTTFMYYNWAGSIRVPAVCQYAHKLAQLVGQYIKENPAHSLERQLYYL